MKRFLFLAFTVAIPGAASSEVISFDCRLESGEQMEMRLDRSKGEIVLLTPSGAPSAIPYVNASSDVLVTFWMTGDGEQLLTLSLDTDSGTVALARVGTEEPLLKQGVCTAQN